MPKSNKFAYFQSTYDPQSLIPCCLPERVGKGLQGLKKGKAWKGSHSTSKHAITWIGIESRVNHRGSQKWPTCVGIQWQQCKQRGCEAVPANTNFCRELGKEEKNESLQMMYADLQRMFLCTAQILGNKYNYSDGSLCHFHLYSKIKQLRAHARSLQAKIWSGPTICFPCFSLLSCCWNMQPLSLN